MKFGHYIAIEEKILLNWNHLLINVMKNIAYQLF